MFISRLTLVETVSVFALKVRTGEFPAAEFARLRAVFAAHVARRRYQVFRLLNVHYDRAGPDREPRPSPPDPHPRCPPAQRRPPAPPARAHRPVRLRRSAAVRHRAARGVGHRQSRASLTPPTTENPGVGIAGRDRKIGAGHQVRRPFPLPGRRTAGLPHRTPCGSPGLDRSRRTRRRIGPVRDRPGRPRHLGPIGSGTGRHAGSRPIGPGPPCFGQGVDNEGV